MTTWPVQPERPLGPRLRTSLIVLAVGVALGIAGVVVGVSKVVHLFTGSAEATSVPGAFDRQLGTGTWELYQLDDANLDSSGIRIQPSDVFVTGPDGAAPTRDVGNVTERFHRNGDSYLGVVRFTADVPGSYHIQVNAPTRTDVVVERSLENEVTKALPWFGMTAAGGLIAIVGLVLLIVGIVRRRRPPTPAYAPAGYAGAPPSYVSPSPPPPASTPPGWYADPGGSGRNRWWDGTQWTEHLS